MKQGWQIKKLGCLCSFERGLTYSKGDEAAISTKGVLRSNNVDLSSNTLNFDEIKYLKDDIDIPVSKKVKRNSILMCMSNGSKAHLGKVAIIEDDLDYAFGGFMGLLVPDEEAVFPRYFYYALITPMYKSFIKSLSDGANINNLKFADLKEFEIPVPSISEQQRIVALLDAEFAKIDALKANAEKNLQNAKDLFQAALKKELEPKEGWITKTLGEVCDVQCGSTPLRSEPLFWENGTYPWFTVDDIREQGRVITDTKQKITKLAWDKLRVFPANSVLLCCTASVGEYAITTIPLTSNQQFNGLTIKKGIDITPMYLFHFASTLKEKLLKLSGKATIDFVSGTKVKSIEIAFPPVIDQQSIVARLDALNEKCTTLQANYEKTLSLCDDLKQALLRKAFNGEI